MATLFIDCKYGISGDMTLSSLIDLGADQTYIEENLKKLPIDEFEMSFETVVDHGISGKHLKLVFHEAEHHHHHEAEHEYEGEHQHEAEHEHHHEVEHIHEEGHHHETAHVHEGCNETHHHCHEISNEHGVHEESQHHHDHDHAHHNAQQIFHMIERSELPQRVKARSLALFKEVARAESKVHGQPVEEVHFHEVGAMDSIIDFIGVCLALESLDIDEMIFASVPTGTGMINIAHGLYPVPAPATAEILVGVPLADFTCEGELTTPTGAAFAKILATDYHEVPVGQIEKIGYGVGTKRFDHPNVLRSILLKKKN